jgi:hypothetical protein
MWKVYRDNVTIIILKLGPTGLYCRLEVYGRSHREFEILKHSTAFYIKILSLLE